MRAFKLIFAHFLLALILISAFSTGLTASAEYSYDVDFSIKPDKTEVRAGDDLKVDIVVTTRRSGYVAFDFVLNYDESYFTCLTTTFDKDGYKGDGTAVGKFSINYKDPSTSEHPEPTKRDKDYTIRLDFKVNSVEKAGSSNLKGKVSKLNGVNSLDNYKITSLVPATLKDKTIKVVLGTANGTASGAVNSGAASGGSASGDPASGSDTESTSDEVSSTETTYIAPPADSKKSGDTLKVILVIVGGLIVFIAGIVVGYITCQKKLEKSRGHEERESTPSFRETPRRSAPPSPPKPMAPPMGGYAQQNGPPRSKPGFTPQASSPPRPDQRAYAPQQEPKRDRYLNENSFTAQTKPKYGTSFEDTSSSYSNRQQQMQRPYPPQQQAQQSRPQPQSGQPAYAPQQSGYRPDGGYSAPQRTSSANPVNPAYSDNRYSTAQEPQRHSGGGYGQGSSNYPTGGYPTQQGAPPSSSGAYRPSGSAPGQPGYSSSSDYKPSGRDGYLR